MYASACTQLVVCLYMQPKRRTGSATKAILDFSRCFSNAPCSKSVTDAIASEGKKLAIYPGGV